MSADNGVYIAKFPLVNGGFEYRVAHAMAIENVDCDIEQMQDVYRVLIWGDAESFSDETEAWNQARLLASEYEILEYGVQQLTFDRPLPAMTRKEAEKKLNEFWDNYRSRQHLRLVK